MTERSVDVAIVGAGISGLETSRRLEAGGCTTAVFEARGRVGGRLDSVDGLDLGATWFWPNERRVRELVSRLGVPVFAQHLDGDALYHAPDGVQRLDGNPLDVPSGRFADGADSLARAIADELRSGTVRLSTPVTAVEFGVSGDVAVTTPTDAVSAQHVVLALPPALAVERIDFEPALPGDLVELARSTPVWMGSVTKVVARYPTAFWRDSGLSGSGVSHVGPMRELHDMSGADGRPGALFGFVPGRRPGEPTVTETAVIEQLVAMFGRDAAEPTDLHIRDWRTERHTSPSGVEHLTAYEQFGDQRFAVAAAEGRVHWASTETAAEFAGHIEGALAAAERTAVTILERNRRQHGADRPNRITEATR